MSDFDLRALVREVIATSVLSSPTELAAEVDRRISSRDVRAALRTALPLLVRVILSQQRMDSRGGAMDRAMPKVAAPRRGSSKVAARRDWWAKQLQQPVHVGPGEHDWMRLGDCGPDELAYMVSERRLAASRTFAVADYYESLQKTLLDHGVERLRDLPCDLVPLGGAA